MVVIHGNGEIGDRHAQSPKPISTVGTLRGGPNDVSPLEEVVNPFSRTMSDLGKKLGGRVEVYSAPPKCEYNAHPMIQQ